MRRAPAKHVGILALASCTLLALTLLLVPQRSAVGATTVPPPESVLGFVPGEDRKLADWGQVLAWLKALDAASERVSVEEVGKTTEGRPFVMVTVTSPANHARLEEIRRANARIADPRGLPDDEAERIVRDGKAVVAASPARSGAGSWPSSSPRRVHRRTPSRTPTSSPG